MERRGIRFPTLSSQEMSDLVAYLFSTRYFDDRGNAERGSDLFVNKQCNLCHSKKNRTLDLSHLKGQMSPILMAQTMWNHGAKMLEGIRKLRTPWHTIDGGRCSTLSSASIGNAVGQFSLRLQGSNTGKRSVLPKIESDVINYINFRP